MDGADLAEAYYRAIDDDAYDDLAGLLAAGFVHRRPDRTIEGRDRFVRFMREERPDRETTHEIDAVYGGPDGRVAVRGRLLRASGAEWFAFVDAFEVEDGTLARLTTYVA